MSNFLKEVWLALICCNYRSDNMRTAHIGNDGTFDFVWDGDGLPDLMFVVGSGGAAGHLAIEVER